MKQGFSGQLWAVRSGSFYHPVKFASKAPVTLINLHWFD